MLIHNTSVTDNGRRRTDDNRTISSTIS